MRRGWTRTDADDPWSGRLRFEQHQVAKDERNREKSGFEVYFIVGL
jgi:hypothetical protein